MICKNCGAEIADDAKFCTHCGKNADEFKQDTTTLESQDVVKPVYQPMITAQQQPVYQNRRTFSVKTGKGGGWIVFAKVLLWLFFATIIIVGSTVGVIMIAAGTNGGIETYDYDSDMYYYPFEDDIVLTSEEAVYTITAGISIIIASIVFAFVMVCGGFMAIDACLNLKNMNDNLSELIRITAETGNTTERINAAVTEIINK